MIHAIVSRNYSTKPSYIFQVKRELKVWKYIFNLFHFEVLTQNRNPKFWSLSLFVLTFHEYEARFVFGFWLDYKLSLFIFFCFAWSCFVYYLCVIINISDNFNSYNCSWTLMNWQTHVPNIFGLDLNMTFIRFLHFFPVNYT